MLLRTHSHTRVVAHQNISCCRSFNIVVRLSTLYSRTLLIPTAVFP
jgi:hypothetical protein